LLVSATWPFCEILGILSLFSQSETGKHCLLLTTRGGWLPTSEGPRSPRKLSSCMAWRAGKDDLLDGHGALDASGIHWGEPSVGCRLRIVTKFHRSMRILTLSIWAKNDKKNRKYDGEMPEKPKQRPNDRSERSLSPYHGHSRWNIMRNYPMICAGWNELKLHKVDRVCLILCTT